MSLTEHGYRARVVDGQLSHMLEAFGAVCVEGPRWCGKTWASLNQAESVTYIGDPAGAFQNRRLAELDPSLVLTGNRPHLIDGWQEVPGIWDAVRFSVDRSREKGQYLLTGSSTPKRRGVMHSGVGRIGMLPMRPMSLFESGDSSGVVSLRSLFETPLPAIPTGEVSLQRIAELVVRGGWPDSLDATLDAARELTKSYLDLTVEDDASRIDGVRRDPLKFRLLLRSLAPDTVTDYLAVLRRLFILWEQGVRVQLLCGLATLCAVSHEAASQAGSCRGSRPPRRRAGACAWSPPGGRACACRRSAPRGGRAPRRRAACTRPCARRPRSSPRSSSVTEVTQRQ